MPLERICFRIAPGESSDRNNIDYGHLPAQNSELVFTERYLEPSKEG